MINQHKSLSRFVSFLPGWAWFGLAVALTSAVTIGIMAGVIVAHDQNNSPTIETVEAPLPVVMNVTRLPTFTLLPTHTSTNTATPTLTLTFTQASPTAIAQISTPSPSLPTATLLPATPAPMTCTPPDGWASYVVQEGDTLFAFQLGAGRAGSPATVDEILTANCLTSSFLTIGQTLWLPSGAADQAPPSQPVVAGLPAGTHRNANCPCIIEVKPGWRLEQIADAINSTPVAFTGADFMAVTGRSAAIPPRDFLSSVPAGSGLEGFMFPGTYTLQNDTTAEGFRNMMLDAFGANASGLVAPGYTLYQTVILASIIQREVNMPSEQPTVSSVFHNRLAAGKGLAATVTLMYGLGTSGDWWPRICCGMTGIDIPYNTNLHAGLTPTPISSPGLTALQAAANPAQTGYMYFTSRCDGAGIAYSVTYEEHLANVTCGQ